jgi:hypothetical protein
VANFRSQLTQETLIGRANGQGPLAADREVQAAQTVVDLTRLVADPEARTNTDAIEIVHP